VSAGGGSPSGPARLDGRRVAVTRGRGGDDRLAARLRELGAEVLEFPAVSLEPPASWEPLDAALRDLRAFDWVAFASANAVERTLARLAELGIPREELARPRLAAVGPATAEALRRGLRAPDLVPRVSSGEGLGTALRVAARGRRVLVPRAAEGRQELVEILEGAGAQVSAPAAYRTVAVAPAALAPLAGLLERGLLDAVAFASPSAARAVAAALGERAGLLARTCVAVIGATTAEAVRALGWPVSAQPERPGAEALAEAIAAARGARPPGPAAG
jgi:uroporphyrinogen-III synthase/uroporphyrinogen III methyltransferase/synthase